MAAVADVAAQQPLTAQVVGNAFVQQYYHILHSSPGLVHMFYQDISKLGRPEEDGSMSITTSMKDINAKIVSLNYGDFKAEIKSVDAHESFNGGVGVLVTGYLTGNDNTVRNFAQSFFLAPQDKGYFVLNDIFRFVDSANVDKPLVVEALVPVLEPQPESEPQAVHVSDEQAAAVPTQGFHVSEQSTPSAEDTIAREVYNPPENGDVLVVEFEEVPVAEVFDEVPDETHLVAKPSVEIEQVPKKSYASIVMHLKESGATITPPPKAPLRRAPTKIIEQVNPTSSLATDGPVFSSEPIENGNNQDGEGDGYSIYAKRLPMNATISLLEEVFKKFGTIKTDGIQVRRQQDFCFGFVEFEEASSVQKALEASPVLIGGRRVIVEEKRSTRGSNRGRFQSARGSGIRNFGGGLRGGDFNGGRNEFGGIRNREGFLRSENGNGNGGRTNNHA